MLLNTTFNEKIESPGLENSDFFPSENLVISWIFVRVFCT